MIYAKMVLIALIVSGCATAGIETCANKCSMGGLDRYKDEKSVCVCKQVVEW